MKEFLSDLVNISRYYGQKKDYVIAGGGNTSFKNSKTLWVKASGTSLKDITAAGFASLSRHKLKIIYNRKYSDDSILRESEVKNDLYNACISGQTVRPSVETSLHEIIEYHYVVHTHPTLVNAITCSVNAPEIIGRLFGETALYIPYTDPGYILFARVRDSIYEWRKTHDRDPQMIFLQNHGVFVSSDSIDQVRQIYDSLESSIKAIINDFPEKSEHEINEKTVQWLPAIRMLFSESTVKVARIRNNRLIEYFTSTGERFAGVMLPFTPDQIVYCKARPLYLESADPGDLITECENKLRAFIATYDYMPKIIGIKNFGLVAIEDNIRSVQTALDVFENGMEISYLSRNFGGPHFLSERDISFIDNWEVENYRRQVAKSGISGNSKVENKVVIITGGAQGFGEGIAENLFNQGANVVIADINSTKGNILTNKLNLGSCKNEALFSNTDVTNPESVKSLIHHAVSHFGGIDIFVSNAGILNAGGLDEMSMETFEAMTRVNYTGYFLCTKFCAEILKLQSAYKKDYFSDIIQVNSKSGLKGSNRNFAYAGSKFGGIGLTQSFALELMPWRIKVNAVCPGNFFEGPLWSDPEKGLFVQYLRTGKVPGANTIEEVKAYYEKQVPAGRGCRVEDVMKALYYLIDQQYETGQALPVTGGQEMLS